MTKAFILALALTGLISSPVLASNHPGLGLSEVNMTDFPSGDQQQEYTAIVRLDKTVSVFANLIIPNTTQSPMSTYSFRIPGAKPSDLVAYQSEFLECDSTGCYNSDEKRSTERTTSGEVQYNKIPVTSSGDSYTMNLPYAVKPGKDLRALIYYSTRDYIKGQVVSFESFKLPTPSNRSRVNIDGEQGVIISNAQPKTDGRESGILLSTAPLTELTKALTENQAAKLKTTEPVDIKTFESIDDAFNSSYIYEGALVKEVASIETNQTMTLQGEFTLNKAAKALNQVTESNPAVIGVGLAMLLLLILIVAIVWSQMHPKLPTTVAPPTPPQPPDNS